MLLREFCTIASRVVPQYRNRAMQHILDRSFNPNNPRVPLAYLQRYRLPSIEPFQGNAGIKQLAAPNVVNIDEMGLYVLLHGRPGRNFFSGIVINYGFHVNCRSVFGYGLGRLVVPSGREPHFRRLFACLLALPCRYREAIVDYNRRNPSTPFVAQAGPM